MKFNVHTPTPFLHTLLRNCMNCGKDGSHFVPPSFGDEGFFMCKKKVN